MRKLDWWRAWQIERVGGQLAELERGKGRKREGETEGRAGAGCALEGQRDGLLLVEAQGRALA